MWISGIGAVLLIAVWHPAKLPASGRPQAETPQHATRPVSDRVYSEAQALRGRFNRYPGPRNINGRTKNGLLSRDKFGIS